MKRFKTVLKIRIRINTGEKQMEKKISVSLILILVLAINTLYVMQHETSAVQPVISDTRIDSILIQLDTIMIRQQQMLHDTTPVGE